MNMKENGLLIQVLLLEHIGKTLNASLYLFYSTLSTEVTPSFILLAIQGSKVVTYVYELHGDQVDVSKSEFSKA